MSDEGAPNLLGFSLFHNSFSSTMPFLQPHISYENNNNSEFRSPTPLTMMPLKSDGSLCIMAPPLMSTSLPTTMGLSLELDTTLYYHPNASFYYPANKSHTPPVGFGELQGLSLSMSPGSQSGSQAYVSASPFETSNKRGFAKVCASNSKETVHRKSIDTFGQRTSQFRGVTKHRWTGRYEAHLWDNSCKKEGQTRKGRQVYLGGYDMEEKAARAYDLAALKYWGLSTHTNFAIENYKNEIEEMKNMTRQEYVAHLRRKSSGFSRGASTYRGVTRHHQHGRWQARIGRVAGNKDLYLGTFSTQEDAAEAYDVAAIKFRGSNAVTNFSISRYDVEKIMASNSLLAGDHAKRNKIELTEVHEQITSSIDNSPQWKMVPEQAISFASLDSKLATVTSSGNPLFSVGLPDDLVDSTRDQESSKLDLAHFSNSSSLVTSLNSSREGRPEGSSLQLGSRFVGPTSAWISTPVPVTQFPVFAAWADL